MSAQRLSTRSGDAARRAPDPAAGPTPAEPIAAGPVVVGHDGTPAGARVLEAAVDLARRLGAHLDVVHVVTLDDYGIDPDADDYEQQCRAVLADEQRCVAALLAAAPVAWSYHERRGEPAAGLAEVADEVGAAVVVVGATRHSAVHRMVTGRSAVAAELTRQQDRPVLVVPPVLNPRPHVRSWSTGR